MSKCETLETWFNSRYGIFFQYDLYWYGINLPNFNLVELGLLKLKWYLTTISLTDMDGRTCFKSLNNFSYSNLKFQRVWHKIKIISKFEVTSYPKRRSYKFWKSLSPLDSHIDYKLSLFFSLLGLVQPFWELRHRVTQRFGKKKWTGTK